MVKRNKQHRTSFTDDSAAITSLSGTELNKSMSTRLAAKRASLPVDLTPIQSSEPSLKPRRKKVRGIVVLSQSVASTTASINSSVPNISSSNVTQVEAVEIDVLESLPPKSISVKAAEMKQMTSKLFIGAHISIVGGIHEIFNRARAVGARAIGCFLRSQRRWDSKPLSEETIIQFREAMAAQQHLEDGISPSHIVPHGIYLVNCGSPKADVLSKSRTALIEELKRCDALGLLYYNMHPGSTCGDISREECIQRIVESINLALAETKTVTVLLENMSKQGHTIGGDFQELADILQRVKYPSRVGVCLDTCHAFAAGWDLRTEAGYEEMMRHFDATIGLQNLGALHLNDSKAACGAHLDLHEDIGLGQIGLEAFARILRDPRVQGLPMILETPGSKLSYTEQIDSLFTGMEKFER